jgi:hypothetical protein
MLRLFYRAHSQSFVSETLLQYRYLFLCQNTYHAGIAGIGLFGASNSPEAL